MEEMLKVTRQAPQVADAPDAVDLPRPASGCGAEVVFDHVGFRHDARASGLDDVSFVTPPGTTTALVGASGAGKSTIVKLALRLLDPQEGRVLIDGLDARGLGQNTLWVISGDHGEAFGQHPGNVVHSLFIYEENVHVPLIIVAPGLTDREPMRRAPQIASLIDVAPTALALLGIAAPAGWQGRSLLEPIAGAARFHTDHGSWQTGLRHDRWKYILDRDRGSGRLFDLRADPGELTDVAARFPERAARYRADLEADRRP